MSEKLKVIENGVVHGARHSTQWYVEQDKSLNICLHFLGGNTILPD